MCHNPSKCGMRRGRTHHCVVAAAVFETELLPEFFACFSSQRMLHIMAHCVLQTITTDLSRKITNSSKNSNPASRDDDLSCAPRAKDLHRRG